MYQVEDARTNEPLLTVSASRTCLVRIGGNWTIVDAKTNQVIAEFTRPVIKFTEGSDMTVKFRNSAAGSQAAALGDLNVRLHRHYLSFGRWDLKAPDDTIKSTVQERIVTHRATITSTSLSLLPTLPTCHSYD